MTDPPLDRTEVGAELRRLRLAAGLTLVQAAAEAGIAQSTLTRYELGRFDPPTKAVRALLAQYRPDRADRTRLLAATREHQPRYKRVVMHRGAAASQLSIGELERRSVRIRTFSPTVVPGLLQTEAYMRAFAADALDPDALTEWVTNRLARQRPLESTGRRIEQIVTAGALLWGVGGPEVMRGQIDHLVELTRRDDLRVAVIPPGTPTTVLPLHAFDIYDLDDGGTQVHFGTHGGTVTITDDRGVAEYAELFDRLDARAVESDDALPVLRDLGAWYARR